MKKMIFFLVCIPLLAACDGLGKNGEGEIRISFAETYSSLTRSGLEIPDTSDFILDVTGPDGETIYHGPYGGSPESITVDAGSYVVKAVSNDFSKPDFSSPQFGDEQCVVVPDEGVVNVRLECSQMNAGVRLRISSGFLDACPSSALVLKSSEGSLLYSYGERRIAYFKPGNVSLILSQGSKDEVLMTRRLEAQEVLSIGISAVSSGASEESQDQGITIAVDTSRYWIEDSYVIGGDNGKGDSEEQPLTVSQAKASIGEEDVWVSGYIVGGDLTSASASFEAPFSSRTNILLGSRTSSDDRDLCLAVQLPAGDVRDNVNLVDHPGLLGKKVCLKGDIVESYFGLVGLKSVTDFKIL